MSKQTSLVQQPVQPKGNVPPINPTIGMSQVMANSSISQHNDQPRPSVQPHQSGAHEQMRLLKEQNKQLLQEIQNLNQEKEGAGQKIQIMTNLLSSLDIENETQKKQIQELQQFVLLLSSALQNMEDNDSKSEEMSMIQKFAHEFTQNLPFGNNAGGASGPNSIQSNNNSSKSQVINSSRQKGYGQRSTYHPTAHEQLDYEDKQPVKFNIYDKISKSLARMDLLLKENFELKREIVFERKKFIDLNQAYSDLRKNLEEGMEFYPNSINEEYDLENSNNQLSIQQLKENMSQSPDRRVMMQGNMNASGVNTHGNSIQRGQQGINFKRTNFVIEQANENRKVSPFGKVRAFSSNMDVGQQQNAGNQMRPSTKSNQSQISTNDFSSGKWKLEKNKMQQTILTLSQEVEYLSVRNAKLLSDLKRKEPLYDVYVKTSEELLKLRQAHTVLISMIQSENLNIKQSKSSQSILQTGNQGGGQDTDRLSFNSQRQQSFIEENPKQSQNSLQQQQPMQSTERLGKWMQQQNNKPQYRGGIGMDIQQVQDSSARGNRYKNNDNNPLNQSMQSQYNEKQQRNISFGGSVNRQMGMGEFITCGTMFRNDNSNSGTHQGSGQVKKKGARNISKDRLKNQRDSKQMTDLEKQMLNNEYLKILKDPKFSDINVNFLEF